MKINVGNHGYVTDEVSSVDIKDFNSNLENRIKSVTDIAAISRGKLGSNNPTARFKHLLKEAAYNYPVDLLNECSRDVLPEEEERLINTAGRPLEFCPVILRISYCCQSDPTYTLRAFNGELFIDDITDTDLFPLLRFSYVDDFTIHTNYRAVYNFLLDYYNKHGIEGDPADKIPFTSNERFRTIDNGDDKPEKIRILITEENPVIKFKVLRVKAPMFVWAHFMTHTQLSKISQSDRVSEQEDYWLPDDINKRIHDLDLSTLDSIKNVKLSKAIEDLKSIIVRKSTEIFWDERSNGLTAMEAVELIRKHTEPIIKELFLNTLSQDHVQRFLKLLGYEREIYSRAPYYFKYKEFVIGGWLNDPYGWGHLLLERDGYSDIRKSWTQKETKEFSIAIREILFSITIREILENQD